MLPFTKNEFLESIFSYNALTGNAVWLFYAAAVSSLVLLARRKNFSSTLTFVFLAFIWAWMGIVYHFAVFTKINPAAWLFGFAFVVEGILFVKESGKGNRFELAPLNSLLGAFQTACFMYSLLLYPIIGSLSGHAYPFGPIFGLPCPTTIFTFGVLSTFVGDRAVLVKLSIVPLLWSVIATSAAFFFDIYEDLGLPVFAFFFVLLRFIKSERSIKIQRLQSFS